MDNRNSILQIIETDNFFNSCPDETEDIINDNYE